MKNFRTNFLTPGQARQLAKEHGTPLYVYSRLQLQAQAKAALAVEAPYGLTVRYAMKANPNEDILALFREAGLQIDVSSSYEAETALAIGFRGEHILLTSQQFWHLARIRTSHSRTGR